MNRDLYIQDPLLLPGLLLHKASMDILLRCVQKFPDCRSSSSGGGGGDAHTKAMVPVNVPERIASA